MSGSTIGTLTTIPADFGVGGKGLTPGGSTGVVDLTALLTEYKTALEALDAAVASSEHKAHVRTTSTGALPAYTRVGNVLTANANGAIGVQDSVAPVLNKRFLLRHGASNIDNGIHVWTALGAAGAKWVLTRDTDFDESVEAAPMTMVGVSEGTLFGNKWFFCTNDDTVTLNTTALLFQQMPDIVDLASTAAGKGASLIGVQDAADRIAGTTDETALAELAGRLFGPVADDAGVTAITAAQRVDGMIVVKLDDMTLWAYDLGSAAAASDWVLVPDAGAGRWLRKDAEQGLLLPPVADNAALIALTAVDRVDGSLVVQLDTMDLWTYDLGSVAGASDWVVVPTDGVGRWHRYYTTLADLAATTAGHGGELVGLYDPTNVVTATTVGAGVVEAAVNIDTIRPGKPMTNRLRMLGAPGAILEGDTVTIGANVFEFRSSSPPAGGTAGRIWVFNGADSAASRVNFIDAVNGVIDANRITYDGALTETFLAAAGVTLGDVIIRSAATAGGAVAPSATATVTTEVLTTITDIWDAGTCYGGRLQVAVPVEIVTITLTADHIAKGNVQFQFMTVPAAYTVFNRMRVQDEATAVVGNAVSLTLAGGATPNNQVADVVDCILFA